MVTYTILWRSCESAERIMLPERAAISLETRPPQAQSTMKQRGSATTATETCFSPTHKCFSASSRLFFFFHSSFKVKWIEFSVYRFSFSVNSEYSISGLTCGSVLFFFHFFNQNIKYVRSEILCLVKDILYRLTKYYDYWIKTIFF